jgi:hypothetical protein
VCSYASSGSAVRTSAGDFRCVERSGSQHQLHVARELVCACEQMGNAFLPDPLDGPPYVSGSTVELSSPPAYPAGDNRGPIAVGKFSRARGCSHLFAEDRPIRVPPS